MRELTSVELWSVTSGKRGTSPLDRAPYEGFSAESIDTAVFGEVSSAIKKTVVDGPEALVGGNCDVPGPTYFVDTANLEQFQEGLLNAFVLGSVMVAEGNMNEGEQMVMNEIDMDVVTSPMDSTIDDMQAEFTADTLDDLFSVDYGQLAQDFFQLTVDFLYPNMHTTWFTVSPSVASYTTTITETNGPHAGHTVTFEGETQLGVPGTTVSIVGSGGGSGGGISGGSDPIIIQCE